MNWTSVGGMTSFLDLNLLPMAGILSQSENVEAFLCGIIWFITWHCHENQSKCYHFTLDDIPNRLWGYPCPPFWYQDKGIAHGSKEKAWDGTFGEVFPWAWQGSQGMSTDQSHCRRVTTILVRIRGLWWLLSFVQRRQSSPNYGSSQHSIVSSFQVAGTANQPPGYSVSQYLGNFQSSDREVTGLQKTAAGSGSTFLGLLNWEFILLQYISTAFFSFLFPLSLLRPFFFFFLFSFFKLVAWTSF